MRLVPLSALFVTLAYAQRRRALAVCCFLLFMGLSRAGAAVHPVPLDPKTDSAKCIECHEDKTKGKAVHSAMATGCTSCHEIRVSHDVTRVKLITSTPVALCITCHADKAAANIKGTVHSPAVRDCLGCHDPHSSDNKNQLLKPTSGGEKENLCLGCHKTGLNVPEKGSRHAALEMGCDTCHLTHKTGSEPTEENRFHLTKSAPALCVDCHDVKDAGLQKAHQNQPFGSADCLQCHDPHQSAQPKLMRRFQHAPFEAKSCEMCHAPAKDGKVVLTQPDAKSLCLTCHDDKGKTIESSKVPHPGAMGDCTDCHSPHAASEPGLPKSDGVAICTGCHTDIGDLGKKAYHHQPAFGQACSICHTPHGGENDHLLRAKGDILCLACHGPDRTSTALKDQHLISILDGKVKLPEDYFTKNNVVILPLKYGLGHPVENHPVADVMDPTDQRKVKTPLSCLTCHQPHASAQADMLVKDQVNNMAFCDTCHKNRLNMRDTISPSQ